MKRHIHVLAGALAFVLSISASSPTLFSHDQRSPVAYTVASGLAGANTAEDAQGAVSGQGAMKFRVLYTSERLPEDARKVLVAAHGGFTVDRRQGRGETYFALPGAGILQISADLKTIRLLETPEAIRDVNLHNVTIWYGTDGAGYLTFPANKTGEIHTTTLDGTLVHTLHAPTPRDDFDHPHRQRLLPGKGELRPHRRGTSRREALCDDGLLESRLRFNGSSPEYQPLSGHLARPWLSAARAMVPASSARGMVLP